MATTTTSGRKKVKPGAITLDENDCALLISIETQILNESDNVISRSTSQKKVKLKSFSAGSDAAAAAAELISQCKYIHRSKIGLVEDLLRQLQQRMGSTPAVDQHTRSDPVVQVVVHPQTRSDPVVQVQSSPSPIPQPKPIKAVSVQRKPVQIPVDIDPKDDDDDDDDEGGDGDDVPAPVRVLPIASTPGKGKRMAVRRRSRTETGKVVASMERLGEYLDLLYEDNSDEIIKGTQLILQLAQDPDNIEGLCSNSTALGALARVLNENRKKNTDLAINVLDIFLCISSYSDLHYILLENKIGDTSIRIIELEYKRYEIMNQNQLGQIVSEPDRTVSRFLSRQQKLLFIAFYILLNLAEDVQIEVKMVNRGIVRHLLGLLDRSGNNDPGSVSDLYLIAITFLKRLSVMKENVWSMVDQDIIAHLDPVLSSSPTAIVSPDVLIASLRLLFNLSFHSAIRHQICHRPSLLSIIISAASDDKGHDAALKLLYNLTLESDHRRVIAADANLIVAITDRIMTCPQRQVDLTLIGVAVNLSTDHRCAEIMVDKERLAALMRRVMMANDPHLLKLIHNLSVHPGKGKENLVRYIQDLMTLAKRSVSNDTLVELLGILGNIDVPGTAFSRFLTHIEFVDFLAKHLVPGFTDDDIVLAVVIVLGTLASDPSSAPILAIDRLVKHLVDILTEKYDDEEIVLQTIFTVYRFLLHDETRSVLISTPGLCDRLVRLQEDDNNVQIRSLATNCLDIISSTSPSQPNRDRLRDQIFECHNFEWSQYASRSGLNVKSDQYSSDVRRGGESRIGIGRDYDVAISPIDRWSDDDDDDDDRSHPPPSPIM